MEKMNYVEKRHMFCAASFLLVLLMMSCAPKNASDIRIGVAVPLTGSSSSYGESAREGLELALKTMDGVDLIYEDTKCSPMDAVNAMNKLATIDSVSFVIGDICSHASMAMAPLAQRNDVLMLAPGTAAPKFTSLGDLLFRMKIGADKDSAELARVSRELLAFERVAILSIQNDYGLGVKEGFLSSFEELGGEIVFEEDFLVGEKDFRTLIKRINVSDADFVMISAFPIELGTFLRQFREFGDEQIPVLTHVGSITSDTFELAGSAMNDLMFVDEFEFEGDSEKTSAFVKSYMDAYDRRPDLFAANSYDAVKILVDGIRACEGEVRCVREKLVSMAPHEGVSSTFHFDEEGNILKPMFLRVIKDGTYTKYEK